MDKKIWNMASRKGGHVPVSEEVMEKARREKIEAVRKHPWLACESPGEGEIAWRDWLAGHFPLEGVR